MSESDRRQHSEPEGRDDQHQSDGGSGHNERRMYARFGLMIATSTVVMFLLTYTNVFAGGHIHWSEERVYMALLMGAAMAIVMLSFMATMMYKNRRINIAIVVMALLVGGGALYLSRSQALVDDGAYMKGMIPHHSIAILTSERAQIDDLRVRELADGIASAQRKEIKEMEWLLDDIAAHGEATTPEEAKRRPVPEFQGRGIASDVPARLGADEVALATARVGGHLDRLR